MEAIDIKFQGKRYKYTQLGRIVTWVDNENMAVPVFLHTKLREYAIEQGYDVGIFIRKKSELPPDPNKPKQKVFKKRKNKGRFNPFNI